MVQGDLGHAVSGLLKAGGSRIGDNSSSAYKRWEREVLHDSAGGGFGAVMGGCLRSHGCPPCLPGGLMTRVPCRKARRFLKMPLSSPCLQAAASLEVFQGRDGGMLSFPGFGHPHQEISQMSIWDLTFPAGKPQVVYALLWADQPWFLQLLLHTAPCGIRALLLARC